jgi:hypothetical protein
MMNLEEVVGTSTGIDKGGLKVTARRKYSPSVGQWPICVATLAQKDKAGQAPWAEAWRA